MWGLGMSHELGCLQYGQSLLVSGTLLIESDIRIRVRSKTHGVKVLGLHYGGVFPSSP